VYIPLKKLEKLLENIVLEIKNSDSNRKIIIFYKILYTDFMRFYTKTISNVCDFVVFSRNFNIKRLFKTIEDTIIFYAFLLKTNNKKPCNTFLNI
jgi:hypothetical protein